MAPSFKAKDIVAAMYRTVLLREPDPIGLVHAVNQLEQHGSIEQMIGGMITSVEFATRLPTFKEHYGISDTGRSAEAITPIHPQHVGGLESPDAIRDFIVSHPAWRGVDVLAQTDYPAAHMNNPSVYKCSIEEDRATLERRGIRVHGIAHGCETIIICDELAAPISVDVFCGGFTGNVILFGDECKMQGDIRFGGSGNLAYCGGSVGFDQHYRITFYASMSAFVFGAGSTSLGSYFHIEGPSRYIVVSKDCMFSAETYVAGTDNHAILDKDSGEIVNPPEDILICAHAWIGFGATILKGVKVGENAIVAAKAVLTQAAPPGTLMAGTPARIIREGVTWDRALPSILYAERSVATS